MVLLEYLYTNVSVKTYTSKNETNILIYYISKRQKYV